MAMASALIADGKTGVIYNDQYDLWSPARQYMLYHGQPRILTEIASANLADPFYNPAGATRPLGPQQARSNFPAPYDRGVWRLADIVEYGRIAVFAGLEQMAKYRIRWLENFYRVHRDWVSRAEPPYAFVIPAVQRDPYETYELLEILHVGEVEIHRARAPFAAGGTTFAAGSWVIQLAQPYGAFAKTMLERQVYPDLRYYPGGPPIPPYDVTGHTLGLLMGVDVHQIDEPVRADLELLEEITVPRTPVPARPDWAYTISPASNAAFLAATALQSAGVPLFRTAAAADPSGDGNRLEPGTWIVPPTGDAERILDRVAGETGLVVSAAAAPPPVDGFRLKNPTRVGLWRIPNNMPGGWMLWILEQYGIDHRVVSSTDFRGDLADQYDVIVLPAGTTRGRMVNGLSPQRHDQSWRWAYGIGERGWRKLRQWVLDGGTLVALGSASETARVLLDLPIEPVLPRSGGRVYFTAAGPDEERGASPGAERGATTVRDVSDPTSVFYCPGSLLRQEHNPNHPVGYGMPADWPVFFRRDQAYRLTPSFDVTAEVVSRYPNQTEMVESGWLLGGRVPVEPGERRLVQGRPGYGGHHGQPDRVPRADARHLQAALQRHLPGTGDPDRCRATGQAGVSDADDPLRNDPARVPRCGGGSGGAGAGHGPAADHSAVRAARLVGRHALAVSGPRCDRARRPVPALHPVQHGRSAATTPARCGPRDRRGTAAAATWSGATSRTTGRCAGWRRTGTSASSAAPPVTATATRSTTKAGSYRASTVGGASRATSTRAP